MQTPRGTYPPSYSKQEKCIRRIIRRDIATEIYRIETVNAIYMHV
jgi:hypothetical protein